MNPDHLDAEILSRFPDYTIHRTDRDTIIGRKQKWGGVLLLTSPGILSTDHLPYSNGCCELKIVNLNAIQVTVILVYRPPDTNSNEFEDILAKIEEYQLTSTSTTTILLGDFNFPTAIVTWTPTDGGVIPVPTTYRSDPVKEQFHKLLQLTDQYFLHQLVSEPTNDINVLDLVFTDATHLFHTFESNRVEGISDHNLLKFKTDLTTVHQNTHHNSSDDIPEISKFNFNRPNKAAFKSQLIDANLVDIVKNASTVDIAKTELINKIIDCAKNANVPLKKIQKDLNHLSKEAKRLFKHRNQMIKKLRSRNKTAREKNEIQHKINEINLQIQQLYLKENKEKEAKIANKIKTNPKAFFKYANLSRKIKTKVGPLKHTMSSGNITYQSGPKQMAEILNKQYQSVFSTPINVQAGTPADSLINKFVSDIPVLKNDVLEAIDSIQMSSAPGPDGITPKFLKEYANEIVDALCALGKRSFDSGEMIDGINLAYITPLFKGGDKSEPVNYRPVAL